MKFRNISIFIGLSVIASLTIFLSCQEPERPEPYPNSDLVLEKLDASCTEAWLKISLTRVDSPATQSIPIILIRDGETVQSFSFTPPETLVVDEGLEPAHGYQYQAQRQSVHDNKVIASSNTLTVTTLDTTSHDFIWTIDTLGDYGSYFMDVAIIDENNIWAVGEIRTDSADYNAAHWDGERWEMMLILPEHLDYFQPIQSIYAFSETNIWFGHSTLPTHYNGATYYMYTPADDGYPAGLGAINAIWGSSPEDVWIVGSGGCIVHYDGSGFTRLESGTEVDLRSISCSDNQNIWVSGYLSSYMEHVLLHYDGQNWKAIIEGWPFIGNEYARIGNLIFGIYADHGDYCWVYTDEGVYHIRSDYDGASMRIANPEWVYANYKTVSHSIRDVLIFGAYLSIWHYNGMTYHHYQDFIRSGKLSGGAIRDELLACVGQDYTLSAAITIIGRRE